MSSSTMTAVQTARNADQPETEDRSSDVHLNGTTRHAPEHVGRSHANGYRFGPGNWRDAPSKGEFNLAVVVDADTFATHGFQLTTYDNAFVSWHECPLDAIDAMKVYAGPCKVVRCSDRVLIKHRPPRRKKP